ncbi:MULTISPECIES: aquaporin [unclassified Streptomyces]|uniref:aquaporin n=1 Tax=unclassified Streptomyces TaxID=2593676 RepID=UPI001660CC96|nr:MULTISPECIES: aquaporin [unclassified Streptomyces]MBD0708061.1 aquaporin family protein [Streptomyces sp. CBMA291]MBD0715845.1 aquaporin family protein [Streptomyces sp. CBMA370]
MRIPLQPSSPQGTPSLPRRALAEFTGTGALVAVVVGSGIRADTLSRDLGVRLLANAGASALGLGLLITLLGPISGAHLNPVVTLSTWWAERPRGGGREAAAHLRGGGREIAAYLGAQCAGALAGALLAEAMFGRAPGHWGSAPLATPPLLLGETVATAGLVLVVRGLGHIGRPSLAPVAVGAYIGAAIWSTSSGSFANPAATLGRSLTDSLTGIAPSSVPAFVLAQFLGAVAGTALAGALYGKSRTGKEPDNPMNR